MILTVSIGNTNAKSCLFRGRRIVRRSVVPTRSLASLLPRLIPSGKDLTGAAVASVVPAATARCVKVVRSRTGLSPWRPSIRCKTGLDIRYARNQLGEDRLCAAVGARARFPGDLLVIDFGTAITLNIVTDRNVFIGGPILPGQQAMLAGLHRSTARLALLKPKPTADLLSANTAGAMWAGTFQLLCQGIKEMIACIEEATGRTYTVIATGGGAKQMEPHIPRISRVEPDLGVRGLLELYLLNRDRPA